LVARRAEIIGNLSVSLGVDDEKHNTFRGASQDVTVFTIIFAAIESFDGKGSFKTFVAVSKLTPCLA
jgi:hypothetical protein